MSRADNLPNWPYLLSPELAAAFVCEGKTKFLADVEAGIWPEPIYLGRLPRWHRRVLETTADRLAGYASNREERLSDEDGPNPWDEAVA